MVDNKVQIKLKTCELVVFYDKNSDEIIALNDFAERRFFFGICLAQKLVDSSWNFNFSEKTLFGLWTNLNEKTKKCLE